MTQDAYRRALDKAGYTHEEPTEQNVRDCFLDYVDSGVFGHVDMDEVEDMPTAQMTQALLRLR